MVFPACANSNPVLSCQIPGASFSFFLIPTKLYCLSLQKTVLNLTTYHRTHSQAVITWFTYFCLFCGCCFCNGLSLSTLPFSQSLLTTTAEWAFKNVTQFLLFLYLKPSCLTQYKSCQVLKSGPWGPVWSSTTTSPATYSLPHAPDPRHWLPCCSSEHANNSFLQGTPQIATGPCSNATLSLRPFGPS